MRDVLITGVFRSGTSLLAAALNAHSQICVAWQPFMQFFRACRNKFFQEVIGRDFDDGFPMGIDCFTSEAERKSFAGVLKKVHFNDHALSRVIQAIESDISGEPKGINEGLLPRCLLGKFRGLSPGSAEHVLSQLLTKLSEVIWKQQNATSIATDGLGASVIGIKEVFCEEFAVPLLDSDSLDFAVIHVLRDPRAVLASRNYGHYREATGSCYPLGFIAQSWRRSVELCRRNAGKPGYLVVRYEDLVRKPEATLRRICGGIGIDFVPRMLDSKHFTDAHGNQWRANSSFDAGGGFSTAPVDRWKSVLPKEEIEVIEYYCAKDMQEFGYDLVSDPVSRDRVKEYHEDVSQIIEWLRKYEFSCSPDVLEPRLSASCFRTPRVG